MSDIRLRELERRWRETGSQQDEVAYFQERIRVGDLSEDSLELAAFCGHRSCQVLMDNWAHHIPTDSNEWCDELMSQYERAGTIACLSICCLVLPEFEKRHTDNCLPREALGCLMRFLADPDFKSEHEENARCLREYLDDLCNLEYAVSDPPCGEDGDSLGVASNVVRAVECLVSSFLPTTEYFFFKLDLKEIRHCAVELIASSPGWDLSEEETNFQYIWLNILHPLIVRVLIRYALEGWDDLHDLLPPPPEA